MTIVMELVKNFYEALSIQNLIILQAQQEKYGQHNLKIFDSSKSLLQCYSNNDSKNNMTSAVRRLLSN